MICIIGASGKTGGKVLNLCKEQGLSFLGTSTSDKDFLIFDSNIDPYPDAETYIFTVPPSKINKDDFLNNLKSISKKRIIFISSTSVYDSSLFEAFEDSKVKITNQSTEKLVEIEKYLISLDNATILRPAGLYCELSHPGLFLSGKKSIKQPQTKINLVSRQFLAKTILKLIDNNDIDILNLVNIHHPLKKDYYTDYCKNSNLPLPSFDDTDHSQSKIINSHFIDFLERDALPIKK